MNRFFAVEKQGNKLYFDEKTLKHFKVLRLENKEIIGVYEGKFYLSGLNGNIAEIKEEINENHEFNFKVKLGVSLIKLERFEWLIEKAVELGATEIIPFISTHTNSEIAKFKFNKKIDRFNEIMFNAAQQSYRNISIKLSKLRTFDEIINEDAKIKIIAHEKVDNFFIEQKINKDVLFLIGPEGGFSDTEVEKAIGKGFQCVSLGKRILRAETAAIYLLSQIEVGNE
ncbi:16S rRNA (uracil(1498)-N(3))-methyltransferase [Mycoplasma anserisalpingitidis]|uniref:16S rRNA (uracil(1498)-N(3))-methyltransferase n=1 Tax=Mycoplasma anserisalpingitidis TaxID=519450 RepID=UPI0011B0F87F|nr:16S rRNA (uracil(1498)-N(3))-methyltransferase [Mycoplasma anserisalpingitidis]QDY87584.1 16S rRNA (uracil(1498)-N(3))-methyltransferase [Mycoplasma anserisalpingitidis]UCU26706.1 16S rRNA (uracil(1498)-N(3))-methyltransferase [Mycoplasma anserisalpingitidis]UCU27546.1 16S rRNA (uracil(1498)-N(3))-methyltransferase [Mycoplasma anserisalpingitidis]